jgi:phosphate transport system permease protein
MDNEKLLANWSITIGGLLVIVAVITIMLFLVSVAIPLAGGGELREHRVYRLDTAKPVAWLNADEYTTTAIRVAADGAVSAFHVPTGRLLSAGQLDFEETATAVAGVVTGEQVAFGFADGTVRFGRFAFEVGVVTPALLPTGRTRLNDRDSVAGATVYRELATGDYRTVTPGWPSITRHPEFKRPCGRSSARSGTRAIPSRPPSPGSRPRAPTSSSPSSRSCR